MNTMIENPLVPCTSCSGSGKKHTVLEATTEVFLSTVAACPRCGGTGLMFKNRLNPSTKTTHSHV